MNYLKKFKSKNISKLIIALILIVFGLSFPVTKSLSESIQDISEPISTFDKISKEINNGEDHYYTFEIKKEGIITFNVVGLSAGDSRLQDTSDHGYVYDSEGSIIEEKIWSDNVFAVHLKPGTYYLRIHRGNKSWSSKYTLNTSFKAVNKTTVTLETTLKVKQTLQLSAVVEPKKQTVTWKSSKSSVATVTKMGLVTAKKKGTTIITATAETGETAQFRVTVK